jgi:hypothetical protein
MSKRGGEASERRVRADTVSCDWRCQCTNTLKSGVRAQRFMAQHTAFLLIVEPPDVIIGLHEYFYRMG